MLTRILSLFKTPAPEPLPEPDARLALGALMVRLAKSDDNYRFEEISLIDRLLAQMNGLNPVEAAKLRATCEKIDAAAPGTRKFALLIRETVSREARIEAQAALWQVMLADGDCAPAELEIIAQIREALGLSTDDCNAARSRASGSAESHDA